MKLQWIPTDKKRFLPLLLLADEQESMIDRYLMRGTMYAAVEGDKTLGVMVFMRLSQGIYELKNLAVAPEFQHKGVGTWMVGELCRMCRERGADTLRVGTADHPKVLAFYQSCGFTVCGREAGYFPRHYDHPIVEDGVTLCDQILLEKRL